MARIPPSLGHRSGYELRVIGYLDEKWPFLADDRLAAAAHGLDVFKKKHADDWQWLLEANAHPDAASETIVRTILKENARVYRMAAYDYDRPRGVMAADLSPEEERAVQHLTPAQRKGLDASELTYVARGILRILKDPAVKRAGGKNPYTSRPFNNPKNPFDITFLAPKFIGGEMRVYTWTGDSLSKGDRAQPQTFATEAEGNDVIRAKVLSEIRRYHPGDDVFITGW